MKVYRRLLVYAKPYGRFIIPFFAFNLLAVFFGVFQFTLIIPLLDFLFNDHSAAELKKYATAPEFSFSARFFKDFFYFHDLLFASYFIDFKKVIGGT